MKAGFFDPYLDTIGGGERYTLTLVEHLSNKGWKVDLLWDKPEIKRELESRFDLDLKRVNFLSISKNVFKKWKMIGDYDLFFWLSDGSIPFLLAKKNILHFQVPFHDVGGSSLANKMKLKKINHIVCNSKFTKSFIDQEYGVNSKVIYPPVDIEKFKQAKKENIILSVGRFSQLLQAKRQDVLVKVFKEMVSRGLTGWKLILAGATDIGGKEYFGRLENQAKSYPIEFFENPDFVTLQKLYGQAKIFWSASGFGVEEEKEPEKVEHFGITTIEAMAAGCVPIVVGKGGVKEIIESGKNGFIWQEERELVETTRQLINVPKLLKQSVKNMVKSSGEFSKERFNEEFDKIIG